MNRSEPVGLLPRQLAATRLQSVLQGDAFAPYGAGEIDNPRDRAFANRLITIALRRQGHLNHILKKVLERGVPKRSGAFEAILRLALVELLFLPDQADHSALFLAVEVVKRDRKAQHLAKLMNGVLRRVQREADQYHDLPPLDLLPDWLKARWIAQYGEAATQGFVAALLAGAPLDLTLRDDDEGLIEKLSAAPLLADSVRLGARDKSVADLPGYKKGRWWVQDMASAMPARLMGLQAKARVLDMCAAPGGKSAQLVKAGYAVTALDRDEGRLSRVTENLDRLGYSADLVVADGTDYQAKDRFDGVLVDAPCSATGTFRRHPEVIWQRVAHDIGGRVKLQRKLLTNAARCLKEGGVLIYSTCSLEPEEGEEQARWLIDQVPNMTHFPITEKDVEGFPSAVTDQGWLRLHPGMTAPGSVEGAMDGFFVARFKFEMQG